MNWRDVPSLSALRAFEAAARTGSFSAAARELNVTHVAVSQHVRQLEKHFGTGLLYRDGQRMVVTEDGAPMAEALTEGFGLVADGARALLEKDRARPLRVATTGSFASGWLMPRMSGFWQQHPDVEVELLTSHNLVDFRRDRVDVALRYGAGDWPGVKSERLLSADYVAVARAGDFNTPLALSDLTDVTWLTSSFNQEDRMWLGSHGIDISNAVFREQGSAVLLMEAVRAGLGVGLTTWAVVSDEVRKGTIDILSGGTDDDGPAYHLVTQPDIHNPMRDSFVKWIRAESKSR